MWARVVECMLGLWLLLSPFIFRHPDDATMWWTNDIASGTLVIVLALASYWRPTEWTHWWTIAVALWLIGFGRFSATPPLEPALQNYIFVGLLLGMMAIIPNEASKPPRAWRTTTDTQCLSQ
jgi:hypothetical protein